MSSSNPVPPETPEPAPPAPAAAPAVIPVAPPVPDPPAKPSPVPPGVWDRIVGFFKHAGVAVAGWFKDIFGSQAAEAFATGVESLLETQLGQIAWTAVQNAESLSTNTEKFSAAQTAITTAAKQAGITVKDSVVNMLIELCVQKLNQAFGPPPAATS